MEQSSNEISTKKDLVVNSTEPSKIDCGLKSYDPSLYRRDYYVNSNAKQQCSTLRSKGSAASTRSDGSSSNVSDDGNYSCSGGSSSSEDHPLSDISSPEPSRSTVLSSKQNNECKNLSQTVKVCTSNHFSCLKVRNKIKNQYIRFIAIKLKHLLTGRRKQGKKVT